MRGRKAEAGVGTLILFTALVLVAGMAAMTFMVTSFSLQGRALLTTERTKEKISVATEITHVFAEDGLDPAHKYKVKDFFIKMKLRAGGKRINLNDTFIGADFPNASADLRFNDLPFNERNCSGDHSTDPATQKGNYSVVYNVKGNHWHDKYLSEGDVIVVCFEAPYPIGQSKAFGIRFVPKPGVATVFESETPDVINQRRVDIYPIRTLG